MRKRRLSPGTDATGPWAKEVASSNDHRTPPPVPGEQALSPRFDPAGSGTPRPEESRPPAAPERPDPDYGKLEEKLSSLASAVTHWESELENSASRSTRLEGAFTVLLSSLEGWKSDIREVSSRTESRVLRGLEVIDSRISRVQPGASPLDSGEILAAIQKLERAFGERIAILERDITAVRASTGSTEGLDTLGRRLEGIERKVSSTDTALAGRLGASFEILERRLSSIEQRLSAPEPDVAERLGPNLDALGTRLGAIEQRLSTPDPDPAERLGPSLDALGDRLKAMEHKLSTPDPDLAGRLGAGFDALASRLGALEQRLSTPDPQLTTRLAGSFEALERRLLSIEQKVSADTELPARFTESLAGLESRIAEGQDRLAEALARVNAPQNAELLVQNLRMLEARLSESQQVLTRKLEAARTEGDENNANQLRHLAILQDQQAALAKQVQAVVEKASEPVDTAQIDRLAEGQERLMEALTASKESGGLDALTSGLAALETKLAAGQTALTSKLETVLAEGDENSATQLRYLGSLEELQASVAKRLHALEAVVKNPLDEQQWERLAKGLEFLDVRLAQSLDSVSSKLDAAIASLTTTLDARTASGQEANLKSAERLWRALRGLEDQITGSYQLVRQSQERLETATANVSSALEELRAVHGARASHTEKLVMEGLENLDGRFAQNLMTVSERLSTAIFGLNKATEEWRSDLANSTEESEERLTTRVSQAETKLAKDLKTGLEALGRREERMLALILGGGAAAAPTPVEQAPEAPPE
jgi:tetrahydromethanopterin S-methyltransferase subunit G